MDSIRIYLIQHCNTRVKLIISNNVKMEHTIIDEESRFSDFGDGVSVILVIQNVYYTDYKKAYTYGSTLIDRQVDIKR